MVLWCLGLLAGSNGKPTKAGCSCRCETSGLLGSERIERTPKIQYQHGPANSLAMASNLATARILFCSFCFPSWGTPPKWATAFTTPRMPRSDRHHRSDEVGFFRLRGAIQAEVRTRATLFQLSAAPAKLILNGLGAIPGRRNVHQPCRPVSLPFPQVALVDKLLTNQDQSPSPVGLAWSSPLKETFHAPLMAVFWFLHNKSAHLAWMLFRYCPAYRPHNHTRRSWKSHHQSPGSHGSFSKKVPKPKVFLLFLAHGREVGREEVASRD